MKLPRLDLVEDPNKNNEFIIFKKGVKIIGKKQSKKVNKKKRTIKKRNKTVKKRKSKKSSSFFKKLNIF